MSRLFQTDSNSCCVYWSSSVTTIPLSIMKAVNAASFGKAAEVLKVTTCDSNLIVEKDQLLVKVFACGITPGDIRMLDSSCDMMRTPPNGFPYVPAGDVCGVVEKCGENATFKVGDKIIATWEMMGIGGMAEYAVIDSKAANLMPANASAVEGAAIVNSAVYAMVGVERAQLKAGARVLVLGGSGGLGTFLVQMVKAAGPSFLACTSTDEVLMKSLGVDQVINYKTTNWWEVQEFQSEGMFDVIIDCAEGVAGWRRCGKVLKSGWNGGAWLAFVLNTWDITMHSVLDAFPLMVPPMWRGLVSSLNPWWSPSYNMMLGGPDPNKRDKVVKMFEEGKFKVVLHNNHPFPFTTDGVVEAFTVMENRKGHGNVVVSINNNEL